MTDAISPAPTQGPGGAVYDLGYVPHTGPRLGRRGAVKAVIKDGVRRVLGLRRKARKKVFPWMLFVIAMLPAVVFVGGAFLLSDFAPDAESPFGGHAEYFVLAATMLMLFIAVAGPELLIPDRTEGVLALYSSRPLSALDYLAAKFAALGLVSSGFLLLPQLVMYLGFAALESRGFASAFIANLGDMLDIVLSTAVFFLAYGAPAALISTFAKRQGPATGVYIAVMFFSTPLAAGLAQANRFGALLSLYEHPMYVTNWIFGRTTFDLRPEDAGFEPWASLAVILGIAALAGLAAIRRYRNLL